MGLIDLPEDEREEIRSKNVHGAADTYLSPFIGGKLLLRDLPTFIQSNGLFMFSFVRHPFER